MREGKPEGQKLNQSRQSAKTLTSHSCEMSQLWGICHKAGMLHTILGRRVKPALKTVCTQTFCPYCPPSWWKCLTCVQEVKKVFDSQWNKNTEEILYFCFFSPCMIFHSTSFTSFPVILVTYFTYILRKVKSKCHIFSGAVWSWKLEKKTKCVIYMYVCNRILKFRSENRD